MCREVEMQNRQGGTSGGSRSIRSTGPTDRDWITQFLYDRWAAAFVVVHGEVIKPAIGRITLICPTGFSATIPPK